MQLAEANKKNANQADRIRILNAEKNNLNAENKTLFAQNRELTLRVQMMAQTPDEKVTLIDDLRKSYERLSNNIYESGKKNAALRNEIIELQRKLEQSEETFTDFGLQIFDLEAEIVQLKGTIESMKEGHTLWIQTKRLRSAEDVDSAVSTAEDTDSVGSALDASDVSMEPL